MREHTVLVLYARYEALLLRQALNRMQDIAYCPRPGCKNNPVIVDDKELGRCVVCEMSFCPRCHQISHGMRKCPLRSDESDEEEENEYASSQYIKKNTKRCPKCDAKIEKNEGCNKMICTYCHTYFCWLCGKQLNLSNPYSHFSEPGTCYNKLFAR
ncbi:hypothetical protein EG68_11830 [Paragonimus skrjabini miyazakii]|uniref:RBR-type E3 ubiquitin transferase n=1 Tax=Paragonimus skrjabini miyazakii TaxID=59628 RepID=A0A8S9YFY3_9TREM|nr:hypothetical protein EG68_11830 [Paragonimus skrjabini miyazakii]